MATGLSVSESVLTKVSMRVQLPSGAVSGGGSSGIHALVTEVNYRIIVGQVGISRMETA